MSLISLVGVRKDYGVRTLFEDLSLHIGERERLGLIGPNGAGKSTLLRLLAGVEPPGAGERRVHPQARIVLVSQEPRLDPERTVLEQVFEGSGEKLTLLRRYTEVSEALALAHASGQDDGPLLGELASLTARMDQSQAWDLEQQVREVLQRLGIGDGQRRVAELSGGYRKRLALAAALVADPDVLLLDEPTNHLDADGVEWLQGWLERFAGAVVLVTHDRYLLDRVTRRIVAVDRGEARRYDGNYAAYLEHRAEEDAAEVAAEARLRNTLRRELAWLRRGPKARSTKQKARLQRIAALRELEPRQGRGAVNLASGSRRLGKRVISAEELSIRAGGQGEGSLLLEGFSHDFGPEDRVGIIGPNGVGKSSLLEGIAGRLMPAAGSLELGATVRLAYFDQHSDVLQEREGALAGRKVIEVVQEVANRVQVDGVELSASQLLERFLFPPAQQHQPVARLSGGERRRLHLCRLLIDAPNVLLLDEPTNDLDVHTLSVLEEFLDDFRGCVVVVSHDRWFLDRTVDRLFSFENGRLRRFEGNYSAYLEARQGQQQGGGGAPPPGSGVAKGAGTAAAAAKGRTAGAASAAGAATAAPLPGAAGSSDTMDSAAGPASAVAAPRRRSFRENRELEAIERDLPSWEQRREALEALLAQPGGAYTDLESLSAELAALVERIAAAEERWLLLSELAG
ncbi:MAG: ABC-F family ATP-binding cassette domain-containing protein [Synechococcaceae cyanobacterium]